MPFLTGDDTGLTKLITESGTVQQTIGTQSAAVQQQLWCRKLGLVVAHADGIVCAYRAEVENGHSVGVGEDEDPTRTTPPNKARLPTTPTRTLRCVLRVNEKDAKKSEKWVGAWSSSSTEDGGCLCWVVTSLGRVFVLTGEQLGFGGGGLRGKESGDSDGAKQEEGTRSGSEEDHSSDDGESEDGESDDLLVPDFELDGLYLQPDEQLLSVKPRAGLAAAIPVAGGAAAGGAAPHRPLDVFCLYAGIDNSPRLAWFRSEQIQQLLATRRGPSVSKEGSTTKEAASANVPVIWRARNLPNDHLDLQHKIDFRRLELMVSLREDGVVSEKIFPVGLTGDTKIRVYPDIFGSVAKALRQDPIEAMRKPVLAEKNKDKKVGGGWAMVLVLVVW